MTADFARIASFAATVINITAAREFDEQVA
jgi:hypothetical protein